MNGQLTKIIDHKARPKARAPQARYIFETVEIKKGFRVDALLVSICPLRG